MEKITKDRWEQFLSVFNTAQHEFRIERLGVAVRYKGYTVGAKTQLAELEDEVEKARKAIEFCSIDPLGKELSELVKKMTIQEILDLHKAIEGASKLSHDDEKRIQEFAEEGSVLMFLIKETHWSPMEIFEIRYEDLTQLDDLLRKKRQMVDYLVKKYSLAHPDKKEEEHRQFMEELIGDIPAAMRRYEENRKRRQIKGDKL